MKVLDSGDYLVEVNRLNTLVTLMLETTGVPSEDASLVARNTCASEGGP